MTFLHRLSTSELNLKIQFNRSALFLVSKLHIPRPPASFRSCTWFQFTKQKKCCFSSLPHRNLLRILLILEMIPIGALNKEKLKMGKQFKTEHMSVTLPPIERRLITFPRTQFVLNFCHHRVPSSNAILVFPKGQSQVNAR